MRLPPDLFVFFKDLSKNNNKPWFEKNKSRYEASVREPLLAFIEAAGEKFSKISPCIVADARKVGGSLFRIYRDVRFSKDKSPYKTQAGIHFRHDEAENAHAPGFYLHLEPGNVFAGAGIWRPDSESLRKIRKGIDGNRKGRKSVVEDPRFAAQFRLEGDCLVRPPKGYSNDHPLVADLKRKDFIAICPLTQKRVLHPNFLDDYMDVCAGGAKFMKFITQSLELPF